MSCIPAERERERVVYRCGTAGVPSFAQSLERAPIVGGPSWPRRFDRSLSPEEEEEAEEEEEEEEREREGSG